MTRLATQTSAVPTAPSPQASAAPAPRLRPSAIRVLLVDDHPLMRQGMKTLIEQELHFEVCGEADNAPRALELAAKLTPDLAIVDITLKSTNGIELTKDLRMRVPEMPILIVSMHEEDVYAERVLRAGAMGYLMKLEAPDKIADAIQAVMRGEIYLSDRLKEKMLHQLVHQRGPTPVSPIEKLSDREIEVFRLIGIGYGTREIAGLLNLSVKTIDSYRENLKTKLGLPTGGDLVRHAIQWMKSQAT
ncbi:MAG TPA: response regulator transcription factor [Opitutaceae bacterium]|nr:response regulator transcription factor [Opitutaceae bacterium]